MPTWMLRALNGSSPGLPVPASAHCPRWRYCSNFRATDPDFQAVYRRHRPMVERSIAWLTRGARRVPYRGVTKNDAWLHHRAAGLNLRRLLNLGLTVQDGTWAIA
jgi:hypothetical protein